MTYLKLLANDITFCDGIALFAVKANDRFSSVNLLFATHATEDTHIKPIEINPCRPNRQHTLLVQVHIAKVIPRHFAICRYWRFIVINLPLAEQWRAFEVLVLVLFPNKVIIRN